MKETYLDKQIKVSVIVPVFNASKYLRQNVESLLGQSLLEVEYFFVDDGSTDGSYDILCEYADKDERMHVLRNTVKSDGAAMARNLGMEKARGKYLHIVDADDYFVVDMLEKLFQTAEKHQADIVVCSAFVHHVQKNIVREEPYVLDKKNFPIGKPFSPHDYANTIFQISAGLSWNKFYRRRFIEDNNIRFFPVRYTDDLVFTLTALACAKRIVTMAEPLVHYRAMAPGSQSVSVAQGFSESGWKADDELFKELCKRGLFEIYRQTFYEAALRSFRNVMMLLKDKRDLAVLYNKIKNQKMTEWGLDEEMLDSLPVKLGEEWKRIKENDLDEYLTDMKNFLKKSGKAVITDAQNSLCMLPKQTGLLVYGVGNHLFDMLDWHPELGKRIARIFDKDKRKQGTKVAGVGISVEAPEALKSLPQGTLIAISAIRYLDEITRELHQLNPGLVCEDIDVVYEKLDEILAAPAPVKKPKPQAVKCGLTNLQKQRLRGRDAQARWRQRFLMECAGARRIFWGSLGVRASFLRRKFLPLMHPGDIYIEEDLSRRGQMQDGLPICIPDALKDIKGNIRIIVLSEKYAAVRERLIDYGYVENVDFVEGRRLIAEDENGYIDVPCIDKAEAGMIVYGFGAHLTDMLRWHPELAGRIARVIDKDPKKVGTIVDKVGVMVEPPEVLRDLPSGTEVAVSAIRYLTEITKDIHALQPGIICRDIDKIWQEYV